jgi:hypothetical protein
MFLLVTVYKTFIYLFILFIFCRDTKDRRDREFEHSEEKEIRIKQEPPDGKIKISPCPNFVTLR